jgi:hypothetical protein
LLSEGSNSGTWVRVKDIRSLKVYFQSMKDPSYEDQLVLYKLLYGQFSKHWETQAEQALMMKLNYTYVQGINGKAKKGDVAKMLSLKKVEQVKRIKRSIVDHQPLFNITVKRVDTTIPYDRMRAMNEEFFIAPVKKKKKKVIIIWMILFYIVTHRLITTLSFYLPGQGQETRKPTNYCDATRP